AADELELVADDLLADEDQVGDRDVALDPIALAEQPAIAGAGEVQDRLAEGLGRDRARIDRRAAQDGTLLDDDRLLAELRRLDGRLLTRRARADHRAIEVSHCRCPRVVSSPISDHHSTPETRLRFGVGAAVAGFGRGRANGTSLVQGEQSATN